jgi:hypothetical protein
MASATLNMRYPCKDRLAFLAICGVVAVLAFDQIVWMTLTGLMDNNNCREFDASPNRGADRLNLGVPLNISGVIEQLLRVDRPHLYGLFAPAAEVITNAVKALHVVDCGPMVGVRRLSVQLIQSPHAVYHR